MPPETPAAYRRAADPAPDVATAAEYRYRLGLVEVRPGDATVRFASGQHPAEVYLPVDAWLSLDRPGFLTVSTVPA